MGLNELTLPASLIADLYKQHLTEPLAAKAQKTETPAAVIPPKGLPFLGKNQKNIGVLVNYPNDVYLPDLQLNFLTSILQACRLNLGDVAIVNHHKTAVGFQELQQQLDCRQLLVFGLTPAALGVEENPPFSAFTVNGCQLVFSPAAEQLNNNDAESKLLKSRLWACLKQLFSV